jgi:hypothetical protein
MPHENYAGNTAECMSRWDQRQSTYRIERCDRRGPQEECRDESEDAERSKSGIVEDPESLFCRPSAGERIGDVTEAIFVQGARQYESKRYSEHGRDGVG